MAIAASARSHTQRRAATTWWARHGLRTIVMVVGLGIFTIWTLFPFVWIIETSIKTNRDLYQQASLLPKHITGVHYSEVLHKTKFVTYIKNSLFVSVGTTVIAMIIGVLSAYAMTRLTFRGRTLMARAIIVTYLVPGALLFIPITQIALQLHLTNKASGLIVIYLIFTVPFCTWLAISYFNTIPIELEDAALVDGATRLQSLVKIVIPLALPALAVIALFAFTKSTDTPKAAATTAGTSAPAASTSATKAPSAVSNSAPATTGSAVAGAPTVAKSFSGKLTAWGIVSFTKDGDNLLGQQMADWGKANNVSVEYVPLDGSTYDAKVAGGIETGAIPDVVMLSGTNTIYYAAQNRLVDLTDVYNDVKGLGGGIYEQLLPYVTSNGKVYSIPMQADLSVTYARLDLIEKATGKRQAPETWDALDEIARKVNDPPKLYGIGFTLGRTPDGDGNIQQLLIADGGTLVDKDGKPAISNDGTVSALTRVQKWWKDKLIPQDSPAWDDTGNNKSYQSRQSAFVFNPASIFAYLDKNDQELLKDTTQAANPKGKSGQTGSSLGTWSWSVFSASKQVDASKAMIRAIMQPDKVEAVYETVGGRWYPVYKDLANAKYWKDRPYFDAFPQGITSAKPAWLPAQATPDLLTQMSAAGQKRIYSEMLQDVVVSNKSPQDAAKAAQTKMEQAFAEAIKK